ELTGYTLKDMPVMDVWLSMITGENAAVLRTRLRELFRGDIRTIAMEFLIRTRGGEERIWSFEAAAPGVLADDRRFIVGMALDITERKRSEELLQTSKNALEAANAMKDQFLANISHELRTPLSVILMWSKLLCREGLSEPDYKEAAEAISRGAEA